MGVVAPRARAATAATAAIPVAPGNAKREAAPTISRN